jgi:hypothetical protein
MVEEDPRIRLKIGDAIYRGTATRVLGEAKRPKLFEAATAKYPQMAERIGDGPPPEGVWVFRVEPR